MRIFNLDEFFGVLKDTILETVKDTDDERELEIARMRYETDREVAYQRMVSSMKSLVLIGLVVIGIAVLMLTIMPVRLDSNYSIMLVAVIVCIIWLVGIKIFKEVNNFRFTGTYEKYLVTDDWYLGISNCSVDVKGEDVNIGGTYLLGIHNGPEFEITREQYLLLDMLDEDEVIVIDLYKTKELEE